MYINDFLRLLEPVNKKRDSQGNYLCHCPAHDDSTESLHVKLGRNKRGQDIILVKCLAGCTRDEILERMGLKQKDLTCGADDSPPWDESKVRVAKPVPPQGQKKETKKADHGAKTQVAAYAYTDEDGQLLYEAIRYRYQDGTKTFRQRRPDPDHPGQWLWELNDTRLVLYRLPEVLKAIRDGKPVWIVEGEKDADNLAAIGMTATSSPMGAGKWSKGSYSDSLMGATCYILPDNDDPGWAHAREIAQSLEEKAKLARILDLKRIWPDLPKKGDVSDVLQHLGAEKTREALEALAADNSVQWADLPALYGKIPGYTVLDGHIAQMTDNGAKVLSNFLALPVEVLAVDDGLTVVKKMEIRGWTSTGHELPRARVPVTQYPGMAWISEHWDIAANMAPGSTVKDKLRYVIAEVGRMTVTRRTEYTHTGWRKLRGQWVYLHGGGAVGADGISTALEGNMTQYRLDAQGHTAREGYKASLGLLDVMAAHVAVPLLCCMYLAPLRSFLADAGIPPGFAAFFAGKGGTRKTTAATLALSHFGNFTAKTPTASFHDTANSVRKKAFALKDMPLLVDDYHPTSSPQERRKMESMAQDLARAFGDNADRGRMNADRTLQASMPPRCLALMTGEDMPQIGESGLARFFAVRVGAEDVPIGEELTAAQDAALRGLYQASMIGYIKWIAAQADEIRDSLKKRWLILRAEAQRRLPPKSHARNMEALAHLMLGWELMLMYGYNLGEIERDALSDRIDLAWDALTQSGQAQAQEAQEDTPENRYLDSLRELMTSKTAYVVDITPGEEERSGGPGMIGWRDHDYYYLMPDMAYRYVNEIYVRAGTQFPLSQRGILRALKEAGLSETEQGGVTKNKWLGGRTMRLLWLPRWKIDGTEPPAEQQGFIQVNEPLPF